MVEIETISIEEVVFETGRIPLSRLNANFSHARDDLITVLSVILKEKRKQSREQKKEREKKERVQEKEREKEARKKEREKKRREKKRMRQTRKEANNKRQRFAGDVPARFGADGSYIPMTKFKPKRPNSSKRTSKSVRKSSEEEDEDEDTENSG